MHFDGSGTAVRDTNWQADAAAGVPISAPEMDLEFDGIATCLSDCMTRDGQSAATQNIPMGSHKITGLANGTASTDAVNYGQLSGSTSARNYLTNPSFRIWQRYANGLANFATCTGVAAGQYTADRWFAIRDGTQTGYTLTQSSPGFSSGCPSVSVMKIQRTAADVSTVNLSVAQSLDQDDAYALSMGGKTLALTAYIKKGANFTGTVTLGLYYSTASNALQANPVTATWTLVPTGSTSFAAAALTTSFVRKTGTAGVVVPVGTISLMVAITISGWVGTAGADDSITVGGVKLEAVDSSVSSGFAGTPFIESAYGDELLRCQRYYWKTFPMDTAPAQAVGAAVSGSIGYKVQVASTTAGWMSQVELPINMRSAVTTGVTTYNPTLANANWQNMTGGVSSGVPTVSALSRDRYLEIINPQVAADAVSNIVRIHATVDNEY